MCVFIFHLFKRSAFYIDHENKNGQKRNQSLIDKKQIFIFLCLRFIMHKNKITKEKEKRRKF